MNFSRAWLDEVVEIAGLVDSTVIEMLVDALVRVRAGGGRVFVLGLGGSAANASHCVNDLRVKCGIEAYAPTDNVAELTARCNDSADGWEFGLARWLEGSQLRSSDAVLILSGSGASMPLLTAAGYALGRATVLGIFGMVGAPISRLCEVAVEVPCPGAHRAGHAESFQAVVWHAVVNHPTLVGGGEDNPP